MQDIPKPEVLIISGDMNVYIGKDRNNRFCSQNSANRNDEYLACLNTNVLKG